MKLFCIDTCVVKGGRIVAKGETYDTGNIPRKDDKEAYELIAAGRMVEPQDPKVAETKDQMAKAEEAKKAEKADKAKKA